MTTMVGMGSNLRNNFSNQKEDKVAQQSEKKKKKILLLIRMNSRGIFTCQEERSTGMAEIRNENEEPLNRYK